MEEAEKERKEKLTFFFVPALREIENSKKIAKNSKNYEIAFWQFFKPKLSGEGREREKIKIVIPFHSVPTRRIIENSKKIATKFKKLKNIIMASFQAKIG